MMKKQSREPGSAIWERVFDGGQEPSLAAARALLKLQFPARDKRRMTELASKARSGDLTVDEEQEIDAYERLGCVLDVIHSQARRALRRPRQAS